MKTKFVSLNVLSAIALAFPIATGAAQAFQPTITGVGFGSSHETAIVDQASVRTVAFQPTTTGVGFSNTNPSVLVAQSPVRIAARGTFLSAEKPTSGSARIVTENGKRYLVLDSNFKTSNLGPDLHVVLDPTNHPPAQYQDKTSFVNLGKLKKYAGEQRYAIPASVNLAQFKSVGIWCQMANATFGYAPLNSTSAAMQ